MAEGKEPMILFRKHYSDLFEAIHNADWIAIQLYSEGLLAMSTRRDIEETPKQTEKNIKLLSSFERVLLINPEKFEEFLHVLGREQYLKPLVDRIRCSLTSDIVPPPPKQRKVENIQLQVAKNQPWMHCTEFCTFVQHIKAIYSHEALPDCAKWPHIHAKKPVHLACIKKEKVSRSEADEFTRHTIHGNIDDILHRKESMEIKKVACLGEDDTYPDIVLIEGAPGVGKTTLASMLCKGWDNQELLRHYFLVLLLRLRDKSVCEATEIKDLFQHPNKAVCQAVVEQIEQCSGNGILLILEGFDELPVQKRTEGSIFLDILQRKYLPLATKLITSRPSATGLLHEGYCITQHIEILGFRKMDIGTYITNEFSSRTSLLEEFNKYLSSYPYISSMMYIPLNCAIVVEVYQNYKIAGSIVPKTSTELYCALVQTLLLRHLYEHSWPKQELQCFRDLPQEVYQQFMHICSIAYNGIKQQKLVFHDLPSCLQNLGLMQCVPELYADTGHSFSHNFLHLTVQEFLAAYYMYSETRLSPEQQLDQFREHCNSSHFKKVFIFLAGLSKLQDINSDHIKSLLLSPEDKPTISIDGLQWLFEAQDTELVGSVLHEDTVIFKPSSQCPNPSDCYALGYCIASSNCGWEIDFSDCHVGDEEVEMLGLGAESVKIATNDPSEGYILILDFRNNNLTSKCLECLNKLSPFLQKLTKLDFCKNKLDSEACTIIAKYFPQMPKMQNICLSLNPIGSGGSVSVLSHISHLNDLEELGLYHTGIGYTDIEALCTQLPSMDKLTLIDVGNNQLAWESIELIINSLLSNVPLRKLAMSYNQLSSRHVMQLAQVLKTNTNLQALYLQGCSISNTEACELASSLSNPSAVLKVLNLNENELAGEAGIAFAQALIHNTTLLELWMVKNELGEKATNILALSLKHNQVIQALKLPVAYQSAIAVADQQIEDHRVIWN